MNPVKRSDLPEGFGVPLFIIPMDEPAAREIREHSGNLTLTFSEGRNSAVYVFYLDPFFPVLFDDEGEELLDRYRVKYNPTPEEIVTGLTGPMGPVGPQGIQGLPGGSA